MVKTRWPHGENTVRTALFADDFDQRALAAAAVEFTVEDLFPRAEIEFAGGDGDHHLAAHELAFHVRVGVILAGAVVVVGGHGLVRGELFEPLVVVAVQPALVVVDEDAGGDVHRVDQAQSFADATLAQAFVDLGGDVDEGAARGDVEPEFLTIAFHGG